VSASLIGVLGIAGILGLIALHVPIGIAMAVAGVAAVAGILGWGPAISLLGSEPTSVLASRELFVIPLFLLMGNLAAAGGLSDDLYKLANACLGHLRGGLAMATIGGCAGFGTVCGSSVATTATMAKVALPQMLERNYSPALAAGSIAAGGTLGILIPPSVIMVLYAFLTEQFVVTLFVAAIIPGILAVVLDLVAIAVYVRLYPGEARVAPRVPWKDRLPAFKQSTAAIVLMLMVSGGIYAGMFTVNEAAAVGAILTLVFAAARRRLTKRVIIAVLAETASNTAMIYTLIIGASIASYFVALSRLPEILVAAIQTSGLAPMTIILLLLVMYFFLGAIFETVSSMILTLPFVFPIVLALGYDPIWWGIINVIVIEIGLITPPIGLNVFVMHGMTRDIPLKTIFAGVIPFVCADTVRLLLITFIPALTLWLPSLMK
jgi:tripartite ATP-independent transporter DctM subunit